MKDEKIFTANIEEVCNFLNISEEEFDNLTVKEIKAAQNGLKETQRQERINNPDLVEQYKQFFVEFKLFCDIFGEDIAIRSMMAVEPKDMITEIAVKKGVNLLDAIKEEYSDLSIYKEFERMTIVDRIKEETEDEVIYLIPNPFQRLRYKDIMKYCLLEKLPYIEPFIKNIDLSSSSYFFRHNKYFDWEFNPMNFPINAHLNVEKDFDKKITFDIAYLIDGQYQEFVSDVAANLAKEIGLDIEEEDSDEVIEEKIKQVYEYAKKSKILMDFLKTVAKLERKGAA